MAGVDEDLRALNPSDGSELRYARLLFDALWSRSSKPGRRFAKEHEILYQHWLRLARVIIPNKEASRRLARSTVIAGIPGFDD